MAEGDLFKLWKLHLVDEAIVQIRAQAAALDPGRKIQAQIDLLEKELAEKGGVAKGLGGELTDLELHQKQIDEKIKKFDADLYSGKVVNPREVENIQREIESLKRQRAGDDVRILELWELVPPAKAVAEEVEKRIAAKKQELITHQHAAMAKKGQLEAEFKNVSGQRSSAAEAVPRSLRDRYESIRQKNGGIGMARVDVKTGSCGMCGMKLPTKSIESAKEDRMVTCESCHRILFFSESLK